MTTKTFDCVAMKHEIQRTLRQRFANVGWAERNRIIRDAMADDPHLARLLRAGVSDQSGDRRNP